MDPAAPPRTTLSFVEEDTREPGSEQMLSAQERCPAKAKALSALNRPHSPAPRSLPRLQTGARPLTVQCSPESSNTNALLRLSLPSEGELCRRRELLSSFSRSLAPVSTKPFLQYAAWGTPFLLHSATKFHSSLILKRRAQASSPSPVPRAGAQAPPSRSGPSPRPSAFSPPLSSSPLRRGMERKRGTSEL